MPATARQSVSEEGPKPAASMLLLRWSGAAVQAPRNRGLRSRVAGVLWNFRIASCTQVTSALEHLLPHFQTCTHLSTTRLSVLRRCPAAADAAARARHPAGGCRLRVGLAAVHSLLAAPGSGIRDSGGQAEVSRGPEARPRGGGPARQQILRNRHVCPPPPPQILPAHRLQELASLRCGTCSGLQSLQASYIHVCFSVKLQPNLQAETPPPRKAREEGGGGVTFFTALLAFNLPAFFPKIICKHSISRVAESCPPSQSRLKVSMGAPRAAAASWSRRGCW